MGNVHNKPEQKRSRRRFTVNESNINPPNVKRPFLFATEPKYKTRDVQMYHIYGITETVNKSRKTVAITDMHNICLDIGSVKRIPVDGIV